MGDTAPFILIGMFFDAVREGRGRPPILDGMHPRSSDHVLFHDLADVERSLQPLQSKRRADCLVMAAPALGKEWGTAGERRGSSRPSTTSASVSAGSVPPRP